MEIDDDDGPVSNITVFDTPVCNRKSNRLFVPNTQPSNTPKRLDDTLTTVIPETPPDLRICPQSTELKSTSFHLNISNLTLDETASDVSER